MIFSQNEKQTAWSLCRLLFAFAPSALRPLRGVDNLCLPGAFSPVHPFVSVPDQLVRVLKFHHITHNADADTLEYVAADVAELALGEVNTDLSPFGAYLFHPGFEGALLFSFKQALQVRKGFLSGLQGLENGCAVGQEDV